MAEPPRQIETCTTNASTHPGNLVKAMTGKRKTKAQIAADKVAKAAQKAEKTKLAEDNLKCVACLEKSIAEEDTNESTLQPHPRPHQAAPHQITDDVKVPLYANESDEGMDNDDLGNVTTDKYKPETDGAASESAQVSQGDDTEDSVIEDQPPKKKQKKAVIRDAIKKINNEAGSDGGDSESAAACGMPAADKGRKVTSRLSMCVVITLLINIALLY